MRQELIDFVLQDMEPDAARALEERLRREPALQRELAELEALFGLMRRGEEVEPGAELRAAVMAAADRALAPSLWQRVRQMPGLFRFRFRTSLRFRVAAISLCAHLALMVILLQILWVDPAHGPRGTVLVFPPNPEEVPIQPPSESFVMRLSQRRLPHETRLKQFGVAGQDAAIERGLAQLLQRQDEDGSFGTPAETAYGALALLAEGDCSTDRTVRGLAIRRAMTRLLADAKRGAVDGAMLAALVEDYSLAYDDLSDQRRGEYVRRIRDLTLRVGGDDMAREALVLADLAGFPIPAGRDLGAAAALRDGDRSGLLDRPATRLLATVVLARGQSLPPDRERVRTWAAGLFREAADRVAAGDTSGVVLLTLQAPYRL